MNKYPILAADYYFNFKIHFWDYLENVLWDAAEIKHATWFAFIVAAEGSS